MSEIDKGGSAHYGRGGRVFYGAVTVGERGQVVVPAQARRDHGIVAGQKLIVLGSPEGIALMSVDKLLEALGDSAGLLAQLRATVADPDPGAEDELPGPVVG